jgi:hypothetical protein
MSLGRLGLNNWPDQGLLSYLSRVLAIKGVTVGVTRDTLTGEVLERLMSQALGTVFSRYACPVLFQEGVACRIAAL